VEISVDEENPEYSSVDGVLFNKDKTVLLQYPLGKKKAEYTVPGDVTKVGTRSFEGSTLERVTISASITEIESGAFFFCKNLKTIDIHAPEDSIKALFRFTNGETQVNFIVMKYDEVYNTCRFCEHAKLVEGVGHDIYDCLISKKHIMETKDDMFLIATREQSDTLDLDTCFRCIYYEKCEIDENDKKHDVIEKHVCRLRRRTIWKICDGSDGYYVVATRTDKVYCKNRVVRINNADDV